MHSSPFAFSLDNKRYHTLNYYNKTVFGKKIHKAVIDCGFTCPNIDGSKGTGGCIFCDGGSGYFTHSGVDIISQLEHEKKRICSKFGNDAEFVAYFQANTNTYAPVEVLRGLYFKAAAFPGVCGISIGTRADCLSGTCSRMSIVATAFSGTMSFACAVRHSSVYCGSRGWERRRSGVAHRLRID